MSSASSSRSSTPGRAPRRLRLGPRAESRHEQAQRHLELANAGIDGDGWGREPAEDEDADDGEEGSFGQLDVEVGAKLARAHRPDNLVADHRQHPLVPHVVGCLLGVLAGTPTFVASGTLDPIAPARVGRALAGSIPGATYREWGQASHALPIQLADEVNSALGAHFAAAR